MTYHYKTGFNLKEKTESEKYRAFGTFLLQQGEVEDAKECFRMARDAQEPIEIRLNLKPLNLNGKQFAEA